MGPRAALPIKPARPRNKVKNDHNYHNYRDPFISPLFAEVV